MGYLPVLNGLEVRKAFERDGWVFLRQSGSHMVMSKTGNPATLSIPRHREVRRGTLRGLIADSGLSVDQFLALL